MPRQIGTLRIIGGKWRGRRIQFPTDVDIRPTHDRIRETLFNWLSPHLGGAIALDLFAGSGALGFEALSRGASTVCFVDNQPSAVASLTSNAKTLGADNASIRQGGYESLVSSFDCDAFDLVFLDPPFGRNYLEQVMVHISESKILRDGARIYVETELDLLTLRLPGGWEIIKQKSTKTLNYYLCRFESRSIDSENTCPVENRAGKDIL